MSDILTHVFIFGTNQKIMVIHRLVLPILLCLVYNQISAQECAAEIKKYQFCMLEGRTFLEDQLEQEKVQTDYCFHKSACGTVDRSEVLRDLFPNLFERVQSNSQIVDAAIPEARLRVKRDNRRRGRKRPNRGPKKPKKQIKPKKPKQTKKPAAKKVPKNEPLKFTTEDREALLPQKLLQQTCNSEFRSRMTVCVYGSFPDYVPVYKDSESLAWPRPKQWGYVQKVGCSLFDPFHCSRSGRNNVIGCLQNIGYVVPNEQTCDLPEIVSPTRLENLNSRQGRQYGKASSVSFDKIKPPLPFTQEQKDLEAQRQQILSFGQLFWPQMKCGVKDQCFSEMSQNCQSRLVSMRENGCWCSNNKLTLANDLNCLADPKLTPDMKNQVIINLLQLDVDKSLANNCDQPCSQETLEDILEDERKYALKLRAYAQTAAESRRKGVN